MKLLLTNDDGIDADGIRALCQAASTLGQPLVVAPAEAHSGCGHRVTTNAPFQVIQQDSGFAVHGTPADCVRVALHGLAEDAEWVLSGINEGGNLGADIYHSGTVAAIREAVLHGRPGIAVSQYRRRHQATDWERSVQWLKPILDDLLSRPWQPGTFWNINLPHPESEPAQPEVVFCPPDPEPLPLSYRRDGADWHYNGNYHQRRRKSGSDVDVCFGGDIAVSLLKVF